MRPEIPTPSVDKQRQFPDLKEISMLESDWLAPNHPIPNVKLHCMSTAN